MIGKAIDMALDSWERVLTTPPKGVEYPVGMMAALAGMEELLRQIDAIKANGGVRLFIQTPNRENS